MSGDRHKQSNWQRQSDKKSLKKQRRLVRLRVAHDADLVDCSAKRRLFGANKDGAQREHFLHKLCIDAVITRLANGNIIRAK